jgi:2-polyprenyl-3-methyl-5-hydroxy-6-metoxy-1,4-benzoquinol methylase
MPQSTARDGSRDATGDAVARPVIGRYLASTWIPALEGVDAKLRSGGRVADIGCGYGYPSIVIAEAYPHATVHGYDYHDVAIAQARDAAALHGLHDRVRFEVADASRFAGGDYDLVLFVDSLHDLGDPVGALRHARQPGLNRM